MQTQTNAPTQLESAPVSGEPQGPWYTFPVDVIETPMAIILRADLPGVTSSEVQTELRDSVLTVTATPRQPPSGMRPVHQEYATGTYRRQFGLGRQIDQEHINAQLREGVLTLTLPKIGAVQPRRIEVKSV